ncbi:glutathione S-transferase C-terminal domain-containing protein [Streptomyces sp. NPDC059134]|uniref:glutathione S-transferase C-terminal domain-containing protein n=1 Tax=Streptomyces sp. NPDC059134 TaxID=3346738 RepID=UPI0036ACEB3F
MASRKTVASLVSVRNSATAAFIPRSGFLSGSGPPALAVRWLRGRGGAPARRGGAVRGYVRNRRVTRATIRRDRTLRDLLDRDVVPADRPEARSAALDRLNHRLAPLTYVLGDMLTAADVDLWAALVHLAPVGALRPYPRLREYVRCLGGHPAFRDATGSLPDAAYAAYRSRGHGRDTPGHEQVGTGLSAVTAPPSHRSGLSIDAIQPSADRHPAHDAGAGREMVSDSGGRTSPSRDPSRFR